MKDHTKIMLVTFGLKIGLLLCLPFWLFSDWTKTYKIRVVDSYNKGIYQTSLGTDFQSGYLEETIFTNGPTFALFAFSGGESGTTVHISSFSPTSRDLVAKIFKVSPIQVMTLRTLPSARVPLRNYERREDAKSKDDMLLKVTYHQSILGTILGRVKAISLESHLNKDWLSDSWKYYISQKDNF